MRADDTIAKSGLPLDTALANVLGLGVDLVSIVEAATRVPADVVSRADLGRIQRGAAADLVWPQALQRTLDELRPRVPELRRLTASTPQVLFLARGSSDNAAMYGRYRCELHAGRTAMLGRGASYRRDAVPRSSLPKGRRTS